MIVPLLRSEITKSYLLILTFSLLDTLNIPQSPKTSFIPQESLNYGMAAWNVELQVPDNFRLFVCFKYSFLSVSSFSPQGF